MAGAKERTDTDDEIAVLLERDLPRSRLADGHICRTKSDA
jgi:hypothetical protein